MSDIELNFVKIPVSEFSMGSNRSHDWGDNRYGVHVDCRQQ